MVSMLNEVCLDSGPQLSRFMVHASLLEWYSWVVDMKFVLFERRWPPQFWSPPCHQPYLPLAAAELQQVAERRGLPMSAKPCACCFSKTMKFHLTGGCCRTKSLSHHARSWKIPVAWMHPCTFDRRGCSNRQAACPSLLS